MSADRIRNTRAAKRRRGVRKGIGRVELIAVAVSLLLFAGLLLPFIYQQRLQNRRQLCERRLASMAQAVLLYHDRHEQLPGYKNASRADESEQPVSWVTAVLPWLGFDPQTQRPGRWADVVEDQSALPPLIPDLLCPSAARAGRELPPQACTWVANTGMPDVPAVDELPPDWPANGAFLDLAADYPAGVDPPTLGFISEHDGLATTLMLTENMDAGAWNGTQEALRGFVWVAGFVDGQPLPGEQLLRINERTGVGDGSIRFARPSSYHAGGVNAAYCDGRVQFLSSQIDYLAFTYLMTSAGERLQLPGTRQPVPPPYSRPAGDPDPE